MSITEEHQKIFRLVQETKEKIRRDRTMRDYTNEDLAQLAEWAEAGEAEAGNALRDPQQSWKEGTVKLVSDKRKAYGAIRQGVDWLLRARILERQQKIHSAPELVEGTGRKPT